MARVHLFSISSRLCLLSGSFSLCIALLHHIFQMRCAASVRRIMKRHVFQMFCFPFSFLNLIRLHPRAVPSLSFGHQCSRFLQMFSAFFQMILHIQRVCVPWFRFACRGHNFHVVCNWVYVPSGCQYGRHHACFCIGSLLCFLGCLCLSGIAIFVGRKGSCPFLNSMSCNIQFYKCASSDIFALFLFS